jgi:hypothetical protein
VKAAAAVLGASLLFFLGVLTGAGRREAVPPPTAIPLGATNQPAGSGASRPSSGAPEGGTQRTTTTTARTGARAPAAGTTPTSTTGATPTTNATTATTATINTSSTTTTTESGQVQQVDNQVDCTSAGKRGKGKREPCPSSTTSSTGVAPGGGGNG